MSNALAYLVNPTTRIAPTASNSVFRMGSEPQNPPRHVAFATDRAYVAPAIVAMHSLLRHWDPASPVRVWLMGDGLTQDDRRMLDRVAAGFGPSVTLTHVAIEEHVAAFPRVGHLSPTTFTRVLLPDLLPETESLLYLDVDLLVTADLSSYPTPSGELLLAVGGGSTSTLGGPNGIDYCVPDLGIDADAPLYNAGVMVMNCRRWREERTVDGIVDFVRRYEDRLRFSDQDAINAVCYGRIGDLPAEWNLQGARGEIPPGVRVLHYTGTKKPWNSGFQQPAVKRWLREANSAFRAAGCNVPAWRMRRMALAAGEALQSRFRRAFRTGNAT